MGGLGAARLQVVDQRLAELLGHGQAQRRTGLRLRDLDGSRVPFEIVEPERSDITQSQSQATCEQEDGVVALASGGAALDHL